MAKRQFEIDTGSETWKALMQRYQDRLETLRRKNDGDLSDIQTAKLRGRINEIREFLALANPAPEQVADEE